MQRPSPHLLAASDLESGSAGSGSERRARQARQLPARPARSQLGPRALYLALFVGVLLYGLELLQVMAARCLGQGGTWPPSTRPSHASSLDASLQAELRDAAMSSLLAYQRNGSLSGSTSLADAVLAATLQSLHRHPRALHHANNDKEGETAAATALPPPSTSRLLLIANDDPTAADLIVDGADVVVKNDDQAHSVVANDEQEPAATMLGNSGGESAAGIRALPPADRTDQPLPMQELGQPPPRVPPGFIRLHDGRIADGRLTQQTCYQSGDEAELCVFEGAVCYDGEGPVILTSNPSDPITRVPDPSNVCMDYRFNEVSSFEFSKCRYTELINREDQEGDPMKRLHGTRRYWDLMPALEREALEKRAALLLTPQEDPLGPAWGRLRSPELALPPEFVSAVHTPNSLRNRGLMPANRRDVFARHIPASWVFPNAAVGWESVRDVADGQGSSGLAFLHPNYPHLRVRRVQMGGLADRHSPPTSVDWMEGGLWLAPLQGQATYNPFISAASSMMGLWAALQRNSSGAPGFANDAQRRRGREGASAGPVAPGAGGPTTTRRTRHVELPSVEVIAHMGNGLEEVATEDELSPWYAGLQGFLLSALRTGDSGSSYAAHTIMWKESLRHFNRSHLLCARHGFMPSFKPKLFSHMADAGALRAFPLASEPPLVSREVGGESLFSDPPPGRAPRRITIMDRADLGGRSWWNKQDVLDAAAATGLHVRDVPRMDFLSFKAQVEAMASTGILVATHGAHLMNMLFLPRGAVVIEVTPPLLKSPTYSNLAAMWGLRYMPVYSRQAVPRDMCHLYASRVQSDPEYIETCVRRNITGYESMLLSICNRFSKASPLVVPQRALRRTLADAVAELFLPETRLGTADCPGCDAEAQALAEAAMQRLLAPEEGVVRAARRAQLLQEEASPARHPLAAAIDASLAKLLDANPDLEWTPKLAAAWEEAMEEVLAANVGFL